MIYLWQIKFVVSTINHSFFLPLTRQLNIPILQVSIPNLQPKKNVGFCRRRRCVCWPWSQPWASWTPWCAGTRRIRRTISVRGAQLRAAAAKQPCWLHGLVNIQKATWNMAIEIVSFPMKNGDFPYYVNVYQRVHEQLLNPCWLDDVRWLVRG